MRRGVVAAIAVAVIAIAGLAAFERRAGTIMLAAALDQRAGLDRTAALPDALHVALCGTGSPLPDPARAGACTVIIAGKRIFVVDSGEDGARNIALMGIPNGRIDGVFLTHYHSDHIDEIGRASCRERV